jgi:aspartate ammonia-lyase
MQTRTEKDSLGERSIPSHAYYGIQTVRAIENFPISGIAPRPAYVEATVRIKRAAAKVNRTLGLLDPKIAHAIIQACDEILSGKLREWFVVDVYQAGAGTSQNMNTNEVIANRAIELLGGSKGDYSIVHPNDHVNMSQSTNDVCPTAIRIAAVSLAWSLSSSLQTLDTAFAIKADEFDHIVKSGRTHLQDAVPVRLGQEFGAYAMSIRKHSQNIRQAGQLELNVMVPVVAFNLLHQMEILKNAVDAFVKFCVTGITANEERCKGFAEASVSLVTALAPYIGYVEAAQIAKEYLSSGKSIKQIVFEKGLMTKDELDEVFDLRGMTEPGLHRQGRGTGP